jgi:glutaredoxin/glutathione-dependent peroxiredoxin
MIRHTNNRHYVGTQGEHQMTVKVGDRVPDGTLTEFIETETAGCSVGPNDFKVADLVKGKKILMFALPGAFTPTCSAKHVPGYVAHHDAIKAKGVDEVWCVAVNDAFVMGAWGRDQKVDGKVRMLGDGAAAWTKAMGLELDLTARNMGVRSQRYAAIIDDGVIKVLAVEAPGAFEVSAAEAMIKHL